MGALRSTLKAVRRAKLVLTDDRGAILVEYVVVLSLVCLGGAVAISALGIPLLALFKAQEAILILPIP